MARKRTGQRVAPRKGSSGQRSSRIRSAPIVREGNTSRKTSRNLPTRSQEARARAFHVLSDLRRDPSKSLSQAASDREVSLRTVRHYIGSQLRQERPGGRISVTRSDRLRATLYIPTTQPDVFQKIRARGSEQRYLVGQWQAAIIAAGKGDFSRISQFPKHVSIDGVRLATSPYEVQRIIEALAESEQKLESLYSLGRSGAA